LNGFRKGTSWGLFVSYALLSINVIPFGFFAIVFLAEAGLYAGLGLNVRLRVRLGIWLGLAFDLAFDFKLLFLTDIVTIGCTLD